MLANIVCWVIAIALILSNSIGQTDFYIRLALAIGFIFVGVLSKTADYYYQVHKEKKKESNM